MSEKRKPEIRFSGFEDDWEQRKLDTITDVRDGTHDSPQYVENGHPFVTSKNVKNGFINYEDIQYVSDRDYEEINKRSKVDKNDILMGMIGTIGNTALVREKPDFAIKNVALIKDIGSVFYSYLYHCLQSNSVVHQLGENLDGGTQKFIALNKIRELDIPVPSEDEQYKIGDYMEKLDYLITLHQRKLDKLFCIKKAMLEKMFPKNGNKKPEIRFIGFTDDWEQRKLGEISNVKDSARISNALWTESGVPYLRASDLSNNDLSGTLFLAENTFQYYKSQTGAPTLGDVLFNGGGEIGKAVLKHDNTPVYVQGGAVLYAQTSISNELTGKYLETYFETRDAQKYMEVASAGGTMKHFTLGPAQAMPIIYPSLSEQIRIGNFFHNLDNLITLHQRKIEKLKNIKKAMLEKMFV